MGTKTDTNILQRNGFRVRIFLIAVRPVGGKFPLVRFTLTREQHCSPATCVAQCESHTFMHKANFNWYELDHLPTPRPPQLSRLYLAGLW
jgi:hypothetical protein